MRKSNARLKLEEMYKCVFPKGNVSDEPNDELIKAIAIELFHQGDNFHKTLKFDNYEIHLVRAALTYMKNGLPLEECPWWDEFEDLR